MGLFDRFKTRVPQSPPAQPDYEPSFELTVSIGNETSRISIPIELNDDELVSVGAERGPRQEPGACWIKPGRTIEVAGRHIDKGLLYLGDNLPAADSKYLIEPALINPSLDVASADQDADPAPHYWPSYEALAADQRGAYLDWLAGARRAGKTAQTYLFLYLYGLERRLLSDPAHDPSAASERSTLIAELERLRSEAGEEVHAAFATFVDRLLGFLEAEDVLRGRRQPQPPRQNIGWEVPMTLRLMIGELAAAKLRLPAELAVSWILTSPEAYLRTPAERCRREFAELFEIRYRERFGEGLELPQGPPLELSYHPGSQGLGAVVEKTRLPDVVGSSHLVEPLRELGRDCCSELDGFSRWLGRNPGSGADFRAAALLPAPLLAGAVSEELGTLRTLLKQSTSAEKPWVIDPGALIDLWDPGAEKLAKKEAVMATQLLEKLGYGIEPDQRFGGPGLRPGTEAILFEAHRGDPRAPSPAYAAASLLLHLLAAVAAADGTVSPQEEELLSSHIQTVSGLYDGERERLHAHVHWLTRSEPKFTGLRKRLEPLDQAQREALGQSVIAIAAADGEIAPEEVKVLGKVFGLLGLDPESVYAELHAASASDTATGPVVVREGQALPQRHRVPSEQRQGLDRAAIDTKIEETALVSTILSGIFEEPEEEPAPELTGGAEPSGPSGLGAAQLEFAQGLAGQESWSRQEVEALAAHWELMVDGALESINEAAFELCGAPLAEGEDPIEIDMQTAKEMLA